MFVPHRGLFKDSYVQPVKFNNFFVSLLRLQVVQHCVSCLGAVVNKVTHNYKFVWACFNRFYGELYFKSTLEFKIFFYNNDNSSYYLQYVLQFECELNSVAAEFVVCEKIMSIFSGALNKLKLQHHEDPNSTTLVANKPFLLRSLFTVGALARHFDFDLEEFKGSNKVELSHQ